MYSELTQTSPLDNCILNAFVVTHLYKEAKLFGLASEPFNWRTGGIAINVPKSTCRKTDISVKEENLGKLKSRRNSLVFACFKHDYRLDSLFHKQFKN